MEKSESINELATAMAKVQADISNVNKNAANPFFKSKYSDLAEVLNTVRPVMAAHGVSVVQFPSYVPPMASVETILMHASGQWMSSICSAPVQKADPQGIGSALTYLRRYSLAAVASVAQEDDDANGASGKSAPPAPVSAKPPVKVNTAVQTSAPPAPEVLAGATMGYTKEVRQTSATKDAKPSKEVVLQHRALLFANMRAINSELKLDLKEDIFKEYGKQVFGKDSSNDWLESEWQEVMAWIKKMGLTKTRLAIPAKAA